MSGNKQRFYITKDTEEPEFKKKKKKHYRIICWTLYSKKTTTFTPHMFLLVAFEPFKCVDVQILSPHAQNSAQFLNNNLSV